MALGNYIPGFIVSYDGNTRRARVSIPGITDGCEVFPEADFVYAIGFRTEDTELRILPGDRVWLDFVNGDPRYPMITGYRTLGTDNLIDIIRIRQTFIEFIADQSMLLKATAGDVLVQAGTTLTLRCSSIVLDGNVNVTGTLNVQGALTYQAGISGNGPARNNGVRVGSDHNHTNVRFGGDISGPPQVP